MRKIHVTRQFSLASGRHGDLIKKKNKKTGFQIRSMGICVHNFRSVSFFVWPGDVTHIQVKLGISQTDCQPHVNFDSEVNLKNQVTPYAIYGDRFNIFVTVEEEKNYKIYNFTNLFTALTSIIDVQYPTYLKLEGIPLVVSQDQC